MADDCLVPPSSDNGVTLALPGGLLRERLGREEGSNATRTKGETRRKIVGKWEYGNTCTQTFMQASSGHLMDW